VLPSAIVLAPQKNPWVRITIDKSAWDDENTCGHPGHTIDKCKNKDRSIWGDHDRDYVLKDHGTRKQLLEKNKWDRNCNGKHCPEKAYWKKWERACPSCRGDACCDRSKGECCDLPGTPKPTVPPTTVPPSENPNVSLVKTLNLGRLFTCENSIGSDQLTVEDAEEFTICYKVCNIGNTKLCNILVMDNINSYSRTIDDCLEVNECKSAPPNHWAICEPVDNEKAEVTAVSPNQVEVFADDFAEVTFKHCEEKMRTPGGPPGNPCIPPDIGYDMDLSLTQPKRPSICIAKAMA